MNNYWYSEEIFDQFLADFADQLPHLGLSQEELRLADQSRLAYVSELELKQIRIEEIVNESSDDEVGYQEEVMSEEMVKRKLKLITDKTKEGRDMR